MNGPTSMSLRSTNRPLTELHDAMLLDLDGASYIGARAVPAAPEAVGKARSAGPGVAFVTNDAGRTPARIAEHLAELGVAAAPEDVVTSAEAAARLVADRYPQGSDVLVVGDTGLRQAVHRAGMRSEERRVGKECSAREGAAGGKEEQERASVYTTIEQ